MDIYARIKHARMNAGISQSRLASMMGVTRSACSQWESAHGTAPRRDRLEQLAILLGVSYEWLATGVKTKGEKAVYRIKENAPGPYKTTMTRDQEELLRLYNALPVKSRIALIDFIRTL